MSEKKRRERHPHVKYIEKDKNGKYVYKGTWYFFDGVVLCCFVCYSSMWVFAGAWHEQHHLSSSALYGGTSSRSICLLEAGKTDAE